MNDLGYCFEKGEGVEQNSTKAVEWYTKAAEKGHSSAMYNLGYCFEKGEGVEQNSTKAVEWYTKAAEKGNSTAMNNLGDCFEKGEGVEQNSTKAVEWYTKAAEKGHSTAMYNLGYCFRWARAWSRTRPRPSSGTPRPKMRGMRMQRHGSMISAKDFKTAPNKSKAKAQSKSVPPPGTGSPFRPLLLFFTG